jgi:SsrA-binding protein
MARKAAEKEGVKVLATNRRARHEFLILETLEAGMALQGTEVKSLREGKVNLQDSYARTREGEMFLVGCHISPYSHGNLQNHDPLRRRKLLLHRREIRRLDSKLAEKGLTLVPLRVYLRHGLVKLELGLAKGKKLHDKRETKKRREQDREMRAGLKSGGRGRE